MAIAPAFRPDDWIRLDGAWEWPQFGDTPSTGSGVVACSEYFEPDGRRGIGADMKGEGVAGLDGRVRTVTFNPWAAVFGRGVDAGVGQHPIVGAGLKIFPLNRVLRGG